MDAITAPCVCCWRNQGGVAGKARQSLLEGEQKPRNQHQFGVRQFGQGGIHLQPLPAQAGDIGAIQGRADDLERRGVAGGKQVGGGEHLQGDAGAGGGAVIGQEQGDVHKASVCVFRMEKVICAPTLAEVAALE